MYVLLCACREEEEEEEEEKKASYIYEADKAEKDSNPFSHLDKYTFSLYNRRTDVHTHAVLEFSL